MPRWWNVVDTRDLKSLAFGRAGSTPARGTIDKYVVKIGGWDCLGWSPHLQCGYFQKGSNPLFSTKDYCCMKQREKCSGV